MRRFWATFLVPIVTLFSLAACVAPTGQSQYPVTAAPKPASNRPQVIMMVDLKSLPETIGTEHQDRVNRFNRLAAMNGITPPEVSEMQLPAGEVPGFTFGIPVVRVVFDERVFFDFNKDTVRPEAEKVLDVMAQNMRRDVPDAKLTILGHTDAVGTDAYNIDLSRRRAQSVMEGLIKRGVRPAILSTVAIGKSQPIQPNLTEEGRARNRRVEFMISASQAANVSLVQHRRTDASFFSLKKLEPEGSNAATLAPVTPALLRRVEVYQPAPMRPAAVGDAPNPAVKMAEAVTLRETGSVELRAPEPASQFRATTPAEYHQRSLNDDYAY
jgi:outer membrane protein OmpA-like peptidoglycan-associated protein